MLNIPQIDKIALKSWIHNESIILSNYSDKRNDFNFKFLWTKCLICAWIETKRNVLTHMTTFIRMQINNFSQMKSTFDKYRYTRILHYLYILCMKCFTFHFISELLKVCQYHNHSTLTRVSHLPLFFVFFFS